MLTFDRAMEHLSLDFLRVCEAAAIESAKTMGQGDRKYSDHVAVEAMRREMDEVHMCGRIVIGEGERDEAPMLYIGEEVGRGVREDCPDRSIFPEIDIAVDPLEGTNLCALGANNAIAVLAAAERGGLLNAPDIYMDKIVVGPSSRGVIDIDAPVKDNLKAIARRLSRDIEDLTVIVLDRSRHKQLIADVLTAAAMKCLNGEIQARLVYDPERLDVDKSKVPPAEEVLSRLREMGINDPNKVYDTNDLAPGRKIIFVATGVTDGSLLRGVRFFGAGHRTHSLVMTTESRHIRFVDTVHVEGGPDTVIRF